MNKTGILNGIKMDTKKFFLLLSIAFFSAALAEANGPVMKDAGNTTEITVDNVDSGGSALGYSNGSTNLIQSMAEPGGITGLSGGTYFLQSGYLGQDLIAPKPISLNASLNVQTGTLNLSWSAPGDDYDSGQLPVGTRFFIATTTVLTDAQNQGYWYNKRNTNTCEFVVSTGVVSSGDNCALPVTGLVEGVTYYFRIWTLDQACNWSDLSSGATMMFLWAPGPITNLTAYQGLYGRSIQLVWTAPGNNGYTGILPAGSTYSIQRSTWAGVGYSTGSVDAIFVSTASVNPGDYQSYNLTSLLQGVTYYVRMWTADERVNWSSMSNSTNSLPTPLILSVTLQAPTYYYFGSYATGASTDTATSFIVKNDGNVIEDYALSSYNSGIWAMAAAPATDTFELQTAFNGSRPSPLSLYNNKNNKLTGVSTPCSATQFTIDGSQVGAQVDPFISPNRNLWFLLSTPLSTSTTAEQDMTFTVTASQTFP